MNADDDDWMDAWQWKSVLPALPIVWLMCRFWAWRFETYLESTAIVFSPGLLAAWLLRREPLGLQLLSLTWLCGLMHTLGTFWHLLSWLGGPPDYRLELTHIAASFAIPSVATLVILFCSTEQIQQRNARWVLMAAALAAAAVTQLWTLLYLFAPAIDGA